MRKVQGAVWTLLVIAGVVHAAPSEQEQRKVWDDVGQAAMKGPVDVPLLDEAVLHVPAGEVFVPQPQADRLLNLFGNPGRNPEMPGLLLPRAPNATWYMPVQFRKSGYVRDDDAKFWDADEMLRSLRDDTDEQNRERRRSGQPAVELVGWSEPPRYDATSRRLVWAMTSRAAGAQADDAVVNYNTCALGRDGYFTLNMVTSPKELETLRPVVDQQLAALEFKPGKRYNDFDPKSDPVSSHGLASLVVADAGARRPGFAAVAGAFFARHGKSMALVLALIVVFAGVVAWAVRRTRRATPVPAVFVDTLAESPAGLDATPAAPKSPRGT